MVLMAVARLELTPFIPIFASIDVSAAKSADNKGKHKPHNMSTFFLFDPQKRFFYIYIIFLSAAFFRRRQFFLKSLVIGAVPRIFSSLLKVNRIENSNTWASAF